MAAQLANIAAGRWVQWVIDVDEASTYPNAALVIVLLTTSETLEVLRDYDSLGAVLAAANTEAAFLNYVRKVLVAADIATPAPDDTDNRYEILLPSVTWTAAGGGPDETLTKLVLCYDRDTTSGTDNDILPIGFFDFAYTTSGIDLTAQVPITGVGTAGSTT